MLLGLRSGGTHEKTIRQIARNLKTCGGYFSYLPSPERRTVSREREPVTMHRPLENALRGARPSPQPSPEGEGASNNASAAGVLWPGLWPPWEVSENPLPLSLRKG